MSWLLFLLSKLQLKESLNITLRCEGELFALCPYDLTGQSVEPVLDSSRYFVLRVESDSPEGGSKKKAFIGMGVSVH